MPTTALRVLVLGTAAGGGLPQWNCGCANCIAARIPDSGISPQTQSSVAVSINGDDWLLLNASPDIRTQLASNPVLHPRGLRQTPVRSVVLTNGDIDHIAGLLVLREKQAFDVFSTAVTGAILENNSLFGVLDKHLVEFKKVRIGARFEPVSDIAVELFPVPGKTPLFLEGEGNVETDIEGEQTIGVQLEAAGKKFLYIPGCAKLSPEVSRRLAGTDLLLFDGTVFRDEEMENTGTGVKTGRRMGHMPMSGPGGSLEAFKGSRVGQKVYIHINNTNPVWQPHSAERLQVMAAGWRIAHDGMEIVL